MGGSPVLREHRRKKAGRSQASNPAGNTKSSVVMALCGSKSLKEESGATHPLWERITRALCVRPLTPSYEQERLTKTTSVLSLSV